MNWTYFSFGASIFCGILANWINESANAAYKKNAAVMAEGMRSQETEAKISECKETIKLADNVSSRESKEISSELAKWETKTGYKDQVNKIHADAVTELNNHKENIDYFNRKADIEQTAEDALEEAKESLGYDVYMHSYNRKISNAKTNCKRKIDLLGVAGDDDDDVISELKKIEKKKMQEIVDDAESKKAELNEKLQREESKINRQKNQDLRALESELTSAKSTISQKEKEALSAVNKERDKALEGIRESVHGKRTDAETDALNRRYSSQQYINDQKLQDTRNAVDIYRNAPTSEKWGKWFKANDVPKWFVATIGAIPLIPVGFLIERYVKFVFNTVRAM